MGCEQSKVDDYQQRKGVGATEHMVNRLRQRSMSESILEEAPLPKLDSSGNLMPEEVVKRITSSPMSKTVPILAKDELLATLDYAFVTQRGYYPDDVHKRNQDAFSITHDFAGQPGDSLFVIYDGHGKNGDVCAIWSKKHLPRIIAKYIKQERVRQDKQQGSPGGFNPKSWPLLTPDLIQAVCMKAHLECNQLMHDDKSVEDAMSGTTAIAALFHGGKLTVCNVGDSRAVLGHRIRKTEMEEEKVEVEDELKEDKIVAIPLSRDQTPYRHDECERVKKAGASVMSVDQMEGSEPMHENWGNLYLGEDIDVTGDPPRVWVKDTDYPGTAFTRSIGDKVADGIGVTCEPEMLTRSLNHNDEMLILASDGVFEFLTNQAVVDIAASCSTPVEACEKIVKAAYAQWLHYELRTDDITCIVMFISCDKEPAPGSATVEQLLALAKEGMKPMRINERRTESQVISGDFANDISQKILNGVANTEQGAVVVS